MPDKNVPYVGRNLGTDPRILKGLCDDSFKKYARAFWEYRLDKEAAIKKYPQWAKRFAIDLASLVVKR